MTLSNHRIQSKGLAAADSSALPRKQWSTLIVGIRPPSANSLEASDRRRCGLATARPRTQCRHQDRNGQWVHRCSRNSFLVGRPGSQAITGSRASSTSGATCSASGAASALSSPRSPLSSAPSWLFCSLSPVRRFLAALSTPCSSSALSRPGWGLTRGTSWSTSAG